MYHRHLARTASLFAVATTLFSTTAYGQAAPATTPNATAAEEVAVDPGDIVVTAQKRSENLQSVPISMVALSDQTLTRNHILRVEDLSRLTTNFSATKGSQAAGIRLAIRGVGAPASTATEPSVATFVDGVYIPRSGSVIGTFLDVASVEVLRGPQGTLFGRNASVGALSLQSAQPVHELSGSVTGEIANADRYKLSGFVNVPLGEKVSLRVAGLGDWFGGYWYNRLDGQQYGEANNAAGRATLKAELGNFTWLVRGDYSKATGDGAAGIEFDPNSVSPAVLAAFKARTLGGPDTNLFDTRMNRLVRGNLTDNNWGISSDASLDWNGYTLRMINSYREWQNDQLDGDAVFTPMPLVNRVGGFDSKSHNDELQFISPKDALLGGRFDFVSGLYYFREDFGISEQLNLDSQFCNTLVPAGPRPTCNALLAAGKGANATNQQFSQTVESFAVYGQGSFKILDPLSLTLGGRYTTESKSGTYRQLLNNPFAAGLRAPENANLALDGDKFTWRVSLNYTPDRDLLVFANASTGYKSGGFNSGGGAVALNQSRIFGPETVMNYELGAKSTWLDGALRANITFYRMDIDGYQDRSFDGVSFIVRNAGSLRQQGFEFDTTIRPISNFSVTAALAYLDSKFTDYEGGSGLPGIGGVQDLTGTRNNFSPEFTGNVGADWTGEFGNSGMGWDLNGNISFVSDQNVGGVTDNNLQTVQDGYALLGARFSINGAQNRWSAAVYVNNLTNAGYAVNKLYQVLDSAFGMRNTVFPGSTGVMVFDGTPRSYGISGTFNF